MAGLVVGVDLAALLALAEALGFDRRAAAFLIPFAEPAVIEAVNETLRGRGEG